MLLLQYVFCHFSLQFVCLFCCLLLQYTYPHFSCNPPASPCSFLTTSSTCLLWGRFIEGGCKYDSYSDSSSVLFLQTTKFTFIIYSCIVCTPFSAEKVESRSNFKKGEGMGLTESQFLEGDFWERGGGFFHRSCSFYIKNKLKSEIYIDKKVYEQKCFFLS